MEQQKRVVDLSPYFLVESTGDSEGDFDSSTEAALLDVGGAGGAAYVHHGNAAMAAVDDADDDAESCSHDVCYINVHKVKDIEIVTNGGHDEGDEHYDDHKKEEDGTDTMSMHGKHMERRDHNHHQDGASEVRSTAGSHSLRSSVDSKKEKMSKTEKNRLFWETCLAS
ncbi:hypothetical protein Ancab_019361 [Ancistrocladus abbreviatus]